MQTLMMFGGSRQCPKGGSDDWMGVLPYISEDLIFNVMREHIKQNFENKPGSYWCNILVVRDGTPTEQRRWRYEHSDDAPRPNADEHIVKSVTEDGRTAALIRQPDRRAEFSSEGR